MTYKENEAFINAKKELVTCESLLKESKEYQDNDPNVIECLEGKLRRTAFDVEYAGYRIKINFQLPVNNDELAYGSEQNAKDFRIFLNKLVFFWRDKSAMKQMIKRYEQREMMILRIDSDSLLNTYFSDVYLSNRNSGANPTIRGSDNPKGVFMFRHASQLGSPITQSVPTKAIPQKAREVKEVVVKNNVLLNGILIDRIYKNAGTLDWHDAHGNPVQL